MVCTHELNYSRFGKQRAKSSDAMRSSGRKTPTPETGIPSSGLAPGPGQESGRRDEDAAREKMMNEQAKIQQRYKRLVQQQQEAESAAMNAAAAENGARSVIQMLYTQVNIQCHHQLYHNKPLHLRSSHVNQLCLQVWRLRDLAAGQVSLEHQQIQDLQTMTKFNGI